MTSELNVVVRSKQIPIKEADLTTSYDLILDRRFGLISCPPSLFLVTVDDYWNDLRVRELGAAAWRIRLPSPTLKTLPKAGAIKETNPRNVTNVGDPHW